MMVALNESSCASSPRGVPVPPIIHPALLDCVSAMRLSQVMVGPLVLGSLVHGQYSMVKEYIGENFFDDWNFYGKGETLYDWHYHGETHRKRFVSQWMISRMAMSCKFS